MLPSGIPSLELYKENLNNEILIDMKNYSNDFIIRNKNVTKIIDRVNHWSRFWEYPFVYESIEKFLSTRTQKDVKILDAGSGITFFPFYLNKKFQVKPNCVDYDKKFIPMYPKIDNQIKFNQASLDKLPFEDQTFDIIYCISVLEHTTNYNEIIKEFKRVLKDDGIFILTFDIALSKLDGGTIQFDQAILLLESLYKNFPHSTRINLPDDLLTNNDQILTSKLADKNSPSYPWYYPLKDRIKNGLTLNLFYKHTYFQFLTVFCNVFQK